MKVIRFLSLALFGVILIGLVVPSMTFAESQINFVDRVELISSEDISEDEMKERESQKININLTEENVNDVIEQQTSSVTVVSSETKEVLFKITTNIDDVDVLTNEAVKTLKDNMLKDNIDSEISVNGFFCCVPNAPYRNIEMHYHIVLYNGYCKMYYKTARQCLNCGEVYNISAEKNVNQHKTTSNCP